jgi:hypothetical protein
MMIWSWGVVAATTMLGTMLTWKAGGADAGALGAVPGRAAPGAGLVAAVVSRRAVLASASPAPSVPEAVPGRADPGPVAVRSVVPGAAAAPGRSDEAAPAPGAVSASGGSRRVGAASASPVPSVPDPGPVPVVPAADPASTTSVCKRYPFQHNPFYLYY